MSDALKPQLHGRDHRPGGRDPIPATTPQVPWIELSDGATTAPADGTEMPIPFTVLTYDPALVTQGEIFNWGTTDTGDTGNTRWQVTSIPQGWYVWELRTEWDQTTSAGSNDTGYAVQFLNTDFGGWYFNELPTAQAADWDNITFASGQYEMLENPWLHGRGSAYRLADGARIWLPTARQWTGIDRGLSGVFFRLEYYGTLGGGDDSTWVTLTV